MIAVVDYGVGNLFSLTSSLNKIGAQNIVTNNIKDIQNADSILLPGVGAFADAIQKLNQTGLVPVLKEEVQKGKPLLGICLGMQLLFEKSFEYGEHNGLGFIKGQVCPISDDVKDVIVPHMGWNSLDFKNKSPLFKYIKDGDFVYFVHSYYAKNCLDSTIATANYGIDLTAGVQNKNVFGTQFHPEKSGEVGLKILQAFAEMK